MQHTLSDPASTTINGLDASYMCVKTSDSGYAVVKVLNIPHHSDSNSNSNSNSTAAPNSTECIVQYRCGNPALTSRTIDPTLYTEEQLAWFTDPDPKIPEPMRMVMIEMLRCYMCGDLQSKSDAAGCNDDPIYHESVGDYTYGYRMCTECKFYFRRALFKQIAPIWRFRLLHENVRDARVPVWIARTRYDVNGVRVMSGPMPYKYSQWTIVRWVTAKCNDKYKAECNPAYSGEDSVIVESLNELLIKTASVSDLFIINYGSIADPTYDPNVDDPMNRYSHYEKSRMLAEAWSIAC